jgi:hypothetical protein
MFAYGLILIELAFFGIALFVLFRNNADRYEVNKDIWGVYQNSDSTNEKASNSEKMPTLIFSKSSTSVLVLVPDTDHDPKSPDGTHNFKKAA